MERGVGEVSDGRGGRVASHYVGGGNRLGAGHMGWDRMMGGREERAGIIIIVRGKSYEIPRIMV